MATPLSNADLAIAGFGLAQRLMGLMVDKGVVSAAEMATVLRAEIDNMRIAGNSQSAEMLVHAAKHYESISKPK